MEPTWEESPYLCSKMMKLKMSATPLGTLSNSGRRAAMIWDIIWPSNGVSRLKEINVDKCGTEDYCKSSCICSVLISWFLDQALIHTVLYLWETHLYKKNVYNRCIYGVLYSWNDHSPEYCENNTLGNKRQLKVSYMPNIIWFRQKFFWQVPNRVRWDFYPLLSQMYKKQLTYTTVF